MIERLYTDFYGELLAYCTALAKSRTAGEDLVQETFMRALTHGETIDDLSRSQCRAWLYRTAKNLYIDQVRKLAREYHTEQEELERTAFEEDLTAVAVRQLVNRLPPEERSLFIMRYFQGYNATELGECFGLPPATVRSRLSAARRRLKCWMNMSE